MKLVLMQLSFLARFAFAFMLCLPSLIHAADREVQKPNVILINCDNLGYGDIEPFGSTLHRTPFLNQLAANGRKLTHFYSASGVCTPSRAALMTGCYPRRISMSVTDGAVLRPVSKIGLNPQEWTIGEMFQEAGYATSIFGKWHLGDQPQFLPTNQGFDFYLGIPYSDDMTPRPGQIWPPLPLMKNDKVIEAPTDRDLLAQKLTDAACKWMTEHKEEPFFLYFPQCMPGSTRAPFASEEFKGKSKNGPWGDSIEEIDWSLGEMLATLKKLNLIEKTIVIWTSDNGAPRREPVQGSNAPLNGWGYTTTEGGMRVPCIVSWPGRIPAGTECAELSTMMDFLPTFAEMTGTELPADVKIDGHDIMPLMLEENPPKSPYDVFYYYMLEQLQAVRSGPWKLYLPISTQPRSKNDRSREQSAQLFNVVDDPAESKNLVEEHPEVVKQLMAYAEQGRKALGDYQIAGKEQRPHGIEENPTARVLDE